MAISGIGLSLKRNELNKSGWTYKEEILFFCSIFSTLHNLSIHMKLFLQKWVLFGSQKGKKKKKKKGASDTQKLVQHNQIMLAAC